jgi:hypothetical protein
MTRLALVIALAACSHASAAPTRPAAVAVVEARLGIAPLVVYFSDVAELSMRADGSVWPTNRDRPVFTVHADGRIVGTDGSRGELRADGHVVRPDGSVSQIVFGDDHFVLGGRKATLDAKGVLQVEGPAIGGTPPRVEGIVDATTRRTALLLVGIFLEAGLSQAKR